MVWAALSVCRAPRLIPAAGVIRTAGSSRITKGHIVSSTVTSAVSTKQKQFCRTAAVLLLAGSSYGSSININVKCHSGPTCDARGVLILQSVVNKSIVRRVNLTAASLLISEQPGSEWDMSLDAKGFWA